MVSSRALSPMLPSSFHPAVVAWFRGAFGAPTAAQARGWAEILRGHDTLITAPTGSGKTLAAFLASIDGLVRRADRNELGDGIDVLYVSPLKALSSDVRKNLESPLEGIRAAASQLGLVPPEIRVALRTGDTPAKVRAQILKQAPHVLITTPESLYLMLTSERPRALLQRVRTVIVDELHALMRDKRGSHLALSLARLDAIAERRPQRVGLSATIAPVEEAARFLVGFDAGVGRPCAVVDVGHRRDLDLGVEVPTTDLEAIPTHEQWAEIYDRLAALVREHRTTLVFVNTRRMAERVAHHLGERLGEACVGAHHGSLAKERRLALETRLKNGEMRALVATASLELGIDVGSVDLVCQIGSPRAVTTLLQRIGRSGHALGRTARGRMFATSRDELVECAALVQATLAGHLDRVEPPVAPLDVLAQQLVAECAVREWEDDGLYRLVRGAAPFAELPRAEFDDVVASLREGQAARLGRGGALLHHDRIGGRLRGRRAARLVALQNGGAIPETADYRVVLDPDETFVGTVNEDWAIESMAGDVFVLGSHAWRIRRVESRSGVVRVVDAEGQTPNVPFWLGEAPSRTWLLSEAVSGLRTAIAAALDGDDGALVANLRAECGVTGSGATQMVDYIRAERDALGVVPTMTDVVFERFFDESGGMQLVVHAPFGGRVNRAFGLALRKRFCVSFDFELQAAATDDAIVLSIGAGQSFPLKDAFSFVRTNELDRTLEQAILLAPMFATRWRWNASRALAVLRRQNGKKVPAYLQRMRSDDLLAAVFPAQVACQENATGPITVPDHPLVRQTMRDCLSEAMDSARLHAILRRIEAGEIRLHARDTTEPSPFSHEVLGAKPYAFLDDAPLEERRARAVSLRRTLPEHQRDLAALDPAAIARVVAEAKPAPRDADEVHDVLLGLVASPVHVDWEAWLAVLAEARRAAVVTTASGRFAFAAENTRAVEAIYPGAIAVPDVRPPPALDGVTPATADAVLALVRGHAEVRGPFTAAALAACMELDPFDVAFAVARLESEGLVLRGRFTPGASEDEVCDRRLLARIHRATLDGLRKQIEPVSAQDFLVYLFERHHLTPRTRTGGRAGLREALHKLQGFEIAASSWESDALAARVAGYTGRWLDELCFAGELAWARLSPRRSVASGASAAPAVVASGASAAPAVVASAALASRATPITLAFRRELGWLLGAVRGDEAAPAPVTEPAGQVLDVLRKRGALFLDDLGRGAGLAAAELADALWELVGHGLVTSDGIQPLRDLMASARAMRRRSRTAQGRWSLVEAGAPEKDADAADRVAGQLLARYGVVFREITARESFTLPWRDVLRALRRREARGLARGGRFVAGFVGEQFAEPDAVEALRRVRTQRAGGETRETVRIRPSDPLNLVGILTPGARVPATQRGMLVFDDGALVADRPAVGSYGSAPSREGIAAASSHPAL
jgi:ATP-dependent Lhr-like helicase